MLLQSNKGGEVLPTDYKCRALAEDKSVVIFKNSKKSKFKFLKFKI
jgi:hypothetical protein